MFDYIAFTFFDEIKTIIPSILIKISLPKSDYVFGILGIVSIILATVFAYTLVLLLNRYLKTKKKSVN
jgi:hypothetical protein